MEYITARDSGASSWRAGPGTVDYVDSQRIVVRVEGETERRRARRWAPTSTR
jgi:DNA-directed RNA polymerase beta subunit